MLFRSGTFRSDGLQALLTALQRELDDEYFAEISYQQIAALFGKGENWARVTFYRAKVKIQETMEENKDE